MNYEIGKWYWFEFEDSEPCICRFSETKTTCVGQCFHYDESCTTTGIYHKTTGIYDTRDAWALLDYCKGLATQEQIETCLKAYAKKNGYLGSKVKLIHGAIGSTSEEIKYLEMRDGALMGRNGCNSYTLYHNGEWAEIVQHTTAIHVEHDSELTTRIQEYLTEKDLGKMNVLVNGYSVSLLKCVEVYRKCLEIKKVIG